jgi:hypothetical protein
VFSMTPPGGLGFYLQDRALVLLVSWNKFLSDALAKNKKASYSCVQETKYSPRVDGGL